MNRDSDCDTIKSTNILLTIKSFEYETRTYILTNVKHMSNINNTFQLFGNIDQYRLVDFIGIFLLKEKILFEGFV
jgi:hypothetical protein